MIVSSITNKIICSHIHEVFENLTADEVDLLGVMKASAVSYCVNYTGLTQEELDEFEDITIAVLTLISDMWDERSMTVDKSNVNRVVDTILGMHCINLLPSPPNDTGT